jgi:hypothetical protein
MIIRLAVRVIRGAPAEDVRSDDEDDEDDPLQDDDDPLQDDDDDDDTPLADTDKEKEKDVASLSVANGHIPSNNTTNGIAFSNGIHQRKRKE